RASTAAVAMALERGDQPLPAGTEGLPRAFLQSLRTLFDILDDRRRGYVHLREIESRWRGAEARELPSGVMEGLRRAAPASGYLTFERFVLGLRAALPGADPPAESGGRRSGEKPLSPRCAEERPLSFFCSPGYRTVPSYPGQQQPSAVLCLPPVPEAATIPELPILREMPSVPGDISLLCAMPPLPPVSKLASKPDGTGAGQVVAACSQLKHMKELEQEKDFLLQGLELVECAWEWYHQHIQFMQERQRLLGKNKTSVDFPPEGSQSHLGHLVPKLQEVNRCLGDLLSTAALSRLVPVVSPASAGSQQAINMLKEQNRLLTKEVTDKSERITQLEQEKSALIKQLFEARARSNHETSQLDSTFI
uniref:Suppressor APC domain-containing protein n=1 Tax=Melopsittacus undulatus TaxID=13146 RepID=A0A8V5H7M6_MELUD